MGNRNAIRALINGAITEENVAAYLGTYYDSAICLAITDILTQLAMAYEYDCYSEEKALVLDELVKMCSPDYSFLVEENLNRLLDIRKKLLKDAERLLLAGDAGDFYDDWAIRNTNEETGEAFDRDAAFSDLMSYVFEDKENNALIFDRMKETVKYLPVRMTKEKFFDYLKKGLAFCNTFEKADCLSLYYEMLTAVAKAPKQEYSSLEKDIYDEYIGAVKSGSKTVFEIRESIATKAGHYSDCQDVLSWLMKIVNRMIGMFIAKPYESYENIAFYKERISDICDFARIVKNGEQVPESTILNLFTGLEGSMERLFETVSMCRDAYAVVFEKNSKEFCKYVTDARIKGLKWMNILFSDSDFASLEDENQMAVISDMQSDMCDISNIDELFEEIKKMCLAQFEICDKEQKRLIISRILGTLPILFTKADEFQKYCREAFDTCSSDDILRESIKKITETQTY